MGLSLKDNALNLYSLLRARELEASLRGVVVTVQWRVSCLISAPLVIPPDNSSTLDLHRSPQISQQLLKMRRYLPNNLHLHLMRLALIVCTIDTPSVVVARSPVALYVLRESADLRNAIVLSQSVELAAEHEVDFRVPTKTSHAVRSRGEFNREDAPGERLQAEREDCVSTWRLH
jgi:hypothetical protein